LRETHPDLLPAAELDSDEVALVRRHDPDRPGLFGDNLLARAVPLHGHRFALLGRLLPRLAPPGRARRPDPCPDGAVEPAPAGWPAALLLARQQYAGCLGSYRLGGPRPGAVRPPLAEVRGAGGAGGRGGVARRAAV